MTDTPPQIPAFAPEDLVQAILLIDEGVNQGAYKGWETVQRAIAVRARLLLFAQHWQGTIDAQKQAEEAANGTSEETPAEAPAPKKSRGKKSASTGA